jgi:hypothetical protein
MAQKNKLSASMRARSYPITNKPSIRFQFIWRKQCCQLPDKRKVVHIMHQVNEIMAEMQDHLVL